MNKNEPVNSISNKHTYLQGDLVVFVFLPSVFPSYLKHLTDPSKEANQDETFP